MGAHFPPFLVVGHLNKAHGTKGELVVWPLTDHPESTFAPGVVLRLGHTSGGQPDPFLPAVEIESVRPFRQGFLVRLVGTTDRKAAERLRGRYLLRPFEEAEGADAGEVFYHQLLGMRVETRDGHEVGRVSEVFELDPADLLEVEGAGGRTVLVPFSKQVVVEVDAEGGRIVIDPPEGMLDL